MRAADVSCPQISVSPLLLVPYPLRSSDSLGAHHQNFTIRHDMTVKLSHFAAAFSLPDLHHYLLELAASPELATVYRACCYLQSLLPPPIARLTIPNLQSSENPHPHLPSKMLNSL